MGRLFVSGCAGEAASSAAAIFGGIRIWNVVPAPCVVAKSISPPCCSTTIDRAIASPWRDPLPTSFVVKKCSKTFSWISSGIPPPVSVTAIAAALSSKEVDIEILPRRVSSSRLSAIA